MKPKDKGKGKGRADLTGADALKQLEGANQLADLRTRDIAKAAQDAQRASADIGIALISGFAATFLGELFTPHQSDPAAQRQTVRQALGPRKRGYSLAGRGAVLLMVRP